MQHEKAKELQKVNAGQPCSHPELTKEYYLGTQTGDLVCTTCGEAFSRREAAEIERTRGG